MLLLTVVVFFNTYVWLMSDAISQARLLLALTFLFAVTAAFIVSATRSRLRPMVEASRSAVDTHQMTGTPFATMPDPLVNRRLLRGERLNVLVVLAAAQITDLLLVAISHTSRCPAAGHTAHRIARTGVSGARTTMKWTSSTWTGSPLTVVT